MKVVVEPAAERDLRAAVGYYEEQQRGLGRSLATEFRTCIDRIVRLPDANPRVRGEIRRAIVKRFPYLVFYLVDDDSLVVLGLFHQARHPDRWKRRIGLGPSDVSRTSASPGTT